MGNTVSAAEIAATQIVHPNSHLSQHEFHKESMGHHFKHGEIPPECPMHQKSNTSECPVNQGEINPLNMVCSILLKKKHYSG